MSVSQGILPVGLQNWTVRCDVDWADICRLRGEGYIALMMRVDHEGGIVWARGSTVAFVSGMRFDGVDVDFRA